MAKMPKQAAPPPEDDEEEMDMPPRKGGGMMQTDDEEAEPSPDDEATEGGGQQATPEEQQIYEKFVNNALNLVYDEKGQMRPEVVESLKNPDPVKGLATAVASIVFSADKSAENAGLKVDGEILLHGGAEIARAIADYAGEAGIHKFTDQEMEAVGAQASDKFRELLGKGVNQQAAQEDFQAMIQASKSGNLDSILPGASKIAAQVPQGGENGN
jgi:hypothetical protein